MAVIDSVKNEERLPVGLGIIVGLEFLLLNLPLDVDLIRTSVNDRTSYSLRSCLHTGSSLKAA